MVIVDKRYAPFFFSSLFITSLHGVVVLFGAWDLISVLIQSESLFAV